MTNAFRQKRINEVFAKHFKYKMHEYLGVMSLSENNKPVSSKYNDFQNFTEKIRDFVLELRREYIFVEEYDLMFVLYSYGFFDDESSKRLEEIFKNTG